MSEDVALTGSELASRAGISAQRVGELVRLEILEPDPTEPERPF